MTSIEGMSSSVICSSSCKYVCRCNYELLWNADIKCSFHKRERRNTDKKTPQFDKLRLNVSGCNEIASDNTFHTPPVYRLHSTQTMLQSDLPSLNRTFLPQFQKKCTRRWNDNKRPSYIIPKGLLLMRDVVSKHEYLSIEFC